MALPVADVLDRTGFKVIDAAGSSFMEVLVKYCREDPWEGLDLLRGAIHRTPMRGGMRANAGISFGVTPDALMDLWMRRLNEHGVRSYWIYDVLYGIENFARLARIAKEYGSEVVGTVFFTIPRSTPTTIWRPRRPRSPPCRRSMACSSTTPPACSTSTGCACCSRRSSRRRRQAGGVPRQQPHGHVGPGLRRGRSQGVHVLHTASRPMANGPSVPSTESVVRNLELMGCEHSIDASLLAPVDDHFRRVGTAAGYLVDQVSEYDLFNVTHQVPGGMVGTLAPSSNSTGWRTGSTRCWPRPARSGASSDGRSWPRR